MTNFEKRSKQKTVYKLCYGSKIKQIIILSELTKKCLFFFIQIENHTFDLRRIKRNLKKDKKEKKKERKC